MIDKDSKPQIIGEYQHHANDSGSVEVQVALLTERIKQLTDHLKRHRKDVHSRMGLLKLVGQRRSLLNYLTRQNVTRYRTLINRLGLRR